MIYFFGEPRKHIIAVGAEALTDIEIQRLGWLFGGLGYFFAGTVEGRFIGPRREMVTPWSTNAVEIARNMQISGIQRIEQFFAEDAYTGEFDPMLQTRYNTLTETLFTIDHAPGLIRYVPDIEAYNKSEGLALSPDEVKYLQQLALRLGRNLTDSEVFGFSQVNSEHCRHKIFNGTFIIDGRQMPDSLFQLIKETTKRHPNRVVSAYKDNVAFLKGPKVKQFAPKTQDKADFFTEKEIEALLSLKAETHNFPTTVEPFNGAATGSGGEIRDRLAGGKGSIPLAGTAVYMTAYPRTAPDRPWEQAIAPRPWLYQTPGQILVKASNGASDFGNKYGQPLINGSLFTFEWDDNGQLYAYDKVIMLAGGIGYAKAGDAEKERPEPGDKIVVMGGDNYRIGMGGGAVSSVDTGEFDNAIELNAVQRSNPEMQKRVANVIRALAEQDDNPVVSVHDHGAGGHLNALSELVEETGGRIDIRKLPIGDPTLSAKEIIGNESQERMGLLFKRKDIELAEKIAKRERAPFYVVGEVTGDHRFVLEDKSEPRNPMNLQLADIFGNPPKLILRDKTREKPYPAITINPKELESYLKQVLQLEAVACKDWLTNKVDRSVTGRVATQQTAGGVQLPVNDLGVMALDYSGCAGLATSIGHAPAPALIDPRAGSRLAVAEALTNLVWAPLEGGLDAVSLSANWMWPAKNDGENARLYNAVEALSEFCIELGINVPTGKDSLSMTQKYPDGKLVLSPGTVIISAVGEVSDVGQTLRAALRHQENTALYWVRFAQGPLPLGGSSLAQVLGQLGNTPADVGDVDYFRKAFNALQALIEKGKVLAGHDISAGGLITAALEMVFPSNGLGLSLDITGPAAEHGLEALLFSEMPGVLIQVAEVEIVQALFQSTGIEAYRLGEVTTDGKLTLKAGGQEYAWDISPLRDTWFRSSYLLDKKQSGEKLATERYHNYKKQRLDFDFPAHFTGLADAYALPTGTGARHKAAIIREKGVNGDREMAYSFYKAGFDVKDVHTTDLIAGREDLSDVQVIAFVGGFSNSDVLGSAKGWAGAFLYNPKAKAALDNFYARGDTLSLGVCNGCQLMVELGLVVSGHKERPRMGHNVSGKFESAFVNVDVQQTNAVMLEGLQGSRLGIWVAHGEGRFQLPYEENRYNIPVKFSYGQYPGNPNGSDFNAAAIASADGRHLAIMPHLERSIYPHNWAYYPENRTKDQVSPWLEAFVSARKWLNG